MASLVTLRQLKAQLRLGDDEHDDDANLTRCLAVAEAAVAAWLDRPIAGDEATLTASEQLVAAQAIVLVAMAFEADADGSCEVPRAARALLRPLQSYAR